MSDILVTDDFIRADANPVGGNWSTFTGETAMQIVSNRLRASTASSRNGALYAGTFKNNQFATGKLVTYNADAGGDQAWVMVRGSLVAETAYYSAIVDTNGFGAARGYRITKIIAGAQTDIASTTATINSNDVMKTVANLSQISGYINDFLIATASDTAIESGQPGLASNLGTATANVEFNLFQAGNFEIIQADWSRFPKPPIAEAALRGEM